MCSGIVYKFQCNGYSAIYYDKTKRNFQVRMCERLEILALTGKTVKSDDDVSIKEHLSSSITRLILKLMLNNNVAIKENLFFCNYMSAFGKFFNSHYQQQRF